MTMNYEKAAEILKKHNDILILTHMSPDGDTLGSAYALFHALQPMGKQIKVCCSDEIPDRFAYLKEGYCDPDINFEPDLILAVDIASTQLFGEKLAEYSDSVDLCIDHHPSNTMFAKETLLIPTAAANCESIYYVLSCMNAVITKQIADCLYTGIATDTGCFKYSNTSANTHKIAAVLIEKGAQYDVLNRNLFDTKSKHRIQIEQQVMNGMEFFFDDRVAIIGITQDMIQKSGADESELDGVSSLPRMIEGVEIGITIKEKEGGGHKVSVRTTRFVDASELCAKFGGGGHKRAAGCLIKADYATVKKMLVDAIKPLMAEKIL